MWMYFADMLGRMVNCFWKAFRTINGCIGMIVLLLSFVGSAWAASLKDLSPTYPFAAVVVLFGYLFVKASYEKDLERQAALKVEHEAAGKESVEIEKLRAANEAKAVKLMHVQQQIYKYADSAPLTDCSIPKAEGWIYGAANLLDSLIAQRRVFHANYDLSDSSRAERAVFMAVGDLRGEAARLTFERLK